tara:strand:+ start:13107 stop:13421 length:315 start_codon:yes stop_codon:yes gene_type:complete
MKESDIKYLTQEYRLLSEIETRIEKLKQDKVDYIKLLEKRFRKGSSLKDAQNRLKDFLERNPKSAENTRLKQLESNLRHVLKQLESKKSHIKSIENGEVKRGTH